MTTVNRAAARRSATAAPMPREAPVTIATLLVPLVIFILLMVFASIRVRWEEARPFPFPDNQALSGITIRQKRTIQWTDSTRCGCFRGWWSGAVLHWRLKILGFRARLSPMP